jgi:hypothetical protein
MMILLLIVAVAAVVWGISKNNQAIKATAGMNAMSDAGQKLAESAAVLARHGVRRELTAEILSKREMLTAAVDVLRGEAQKRFEDDDWMAGENDIAPEVLEAVLNGLKVLATAMIRLVSFDLRNGDRAEAQQASQLAVEHFERVTYEIGEARNYLDFGVRSWATCTLVELWGIAQNTFGPQLPAREWWGQELRDSAAEDAKGAQS